MRVCCQIDNDDDARTLYPKYVRHSNFRFLQLPYQLLQVFARRSWKATVTLQQRKQAARCAAMQGFPQLLINLQNSQPC